MRKIKFLSLLLLLGGVFFVFRGAEAATMTWTGALSSTWNTTGNWDGGVVPTSTDDVVINGAYTTAPIIDLNVGGSLTLNSLSLGSSAASVLTISNGSATNKLIITTDLNIGASGTLTHTANTTAQTHILNVEVGGNLNIVSGGKIDVSGKGYTAVYENSGYGPGGGAGSYACGGGGGGGYGGNGGNGNSGWPGGATYGSLTQPTEIGSSGGAGCNGTSGKGGGVLRVVVSGNLTNNGSVVASGTAGAGTYGAGGAGGSIWIVANSLSGGGSFVSSGGAAGDVTLAGGGAGGRIAFEYVSNTFSGTKNAFGGNGVKTGGAGTIYTKQGTANGDLLVDNNNLANGANTTQTAGTNFTIDNVTITKGATYVIPNTSILTAASTLSGSGVAGFLGVNSGGTLAIPAAGSISYVTITNNGTIGTVQNLTFSNGTFYQNGTFSAGLTDLTIGASATFEFQNLSTSTAFNLNNLTIQNGGTLTHKANVSTQTYTLNLNISGNLDVQTGGKIDVNGKGYAGRAGANGYGPGGGTGASGGAGGGGGSYGGNGGNGTTGLTAGVVYGTVIQPNDLGSAGGAGYTAIGGSGGGLARLNVAGTATINGIVSSNGGAVSGGANYSAGGSGGGVWLTADILAGVGSITANGSNAYNNTYAGGGGGGRIAIEYVSSTFNGIKTAFGGSGVKKGGAGTIYTKQGSANGDLLVDNNNLSGADTPQTAGTNFTIDNVTISKTATYVISNTATLTVAAALTNGGGTAFMGVNNGGTLNLPSATHTLAGFTFTNNGVIGTVRNLTFSSGTFYQNGTFSAGLTDLTIGSSGTFEFQNLNTSTAFNLNNITIQNGGVLTHKANGATQLYTLNLNVSGNVDVQTGGKIDVAAKGFVGGAGNGYGPGAGLGNISSGNGSGGGAYGGNGGNGSTYVGGTAYGSAFGPTELGSSGGNGAGSAAGAGGGAVRLNVGGTVAINGAITANAGTSVGTYGAGSAGGSVWIMANTVSGAGTITANGGNSTSLSLGGGGAGGRVAIGYKFYSFPNANISTTGGTGKNAGGVGTIRTGAIEADIVSSPYDTSSSKNVVAYLTWTETLPTGTDIRFQLRTAADNSGVPGTWSTWMGLDGTANTYFTDPTGGETMPSILRDGNNDQWVQYKVTLTSSTLETNPILAEVVVHYVVNNAPQFDNTFGTNGAQISQISENNDPDWGKIKIEYAFKDSDTTSGTVTTNYVTPSFEYSYDGLNWSAVDLADVTFAAPVGGDVVDVNLDGKMDNKVLEGSYLTYTAFWNAKAQVPQIYSTSLHVRVVLNDNEIANNTVATIGNISTMDTKTPLLGAVPIKVDASTNPGTVTLDTTDDSALQMRVAIDASFTSVNWEAYGATRTISLGTLPATVYAQFRDALGNITTIASAVTPDTPTSMMIQDTSNMKETPATYRLFTAWKVATTPTPGFAAYKLYRSPDQNTWSLVGTVTDRLTNYFGDNSVTADTNYYYRVTAEDQDGNISAYSAIVDGKANGVIDAGEGGGGESGIAPVISAVTVDQISTTSARINWTTDILSTSTVGFSTTPASFPTEQGVGSMVTSHSVTISGLTPNTQYYYQVKSTSSTNMVTADSSGGTGYTFTTSAGDVTAPTISNIATSGITSSGATITWNTDENATQFVEYSKTNNFTQGALFGDYTLATAHSVTLQSLEGNTTYYFKVHSKDASNNEQVSAQLSFTTEPSGDVTAPVVSAISSTPTFNSVAIAWTTDEGATSYVEYGLDTNYGRMYGDNNLNLSHNVQLPYDLTPQTTYHYRIHSTDAAKNEAITTDGTFITLENPADVTAPVISAVTAGAATTSTLTITWTTDEAATSYVGYSMDGGNTFSEQGSSTLATFHSVTLVGLNSNTTYYMRVVSADASRNTAIDNNAGLYYVAATAQGPQAPTLLNVATSGITFEEAIISWNTNIAANEFVEYGLDASYGSAAGKYTTGTSHSVKLTNLLPSTTYHYRVRSAAEVEAVSGDFTFMTTEAPDTTAPTIYAVNAVPNINTASISWTTNETATSYVEYGTDINYGKIFGNNVLTTNHNIQLPSDLTADTTYYYRVRTADAMGNMAISDNYVFTTSPLPPDMTDKTAPTISAVVSNAGTTSITVTWNTDEDASSYLAYSADGITFAEQGERTLTQAHSITLAGLALDTTYKFKVISVDAAGNVRTDDNGGANYTQATAALPNAPIISNVVSSVSGQGATITWNTDINSDSKVEYGIDTNYGNFVGNATATKNHSVVVQGLSASATYHFRVHSTDQSEGVSEDYVFTTETAGDSIAPTISLVNADSTIVSALVTWTTDENATSYVEYGTDTNYGSIFGNNNMTANHSVQLPADLSADTIYHYRVRTSDAAGNLTVSGDYVFTTLSNPTDVVAPVATSIAANPTIVSALISWTTDENATSYVEYGTDTNYGSIFGNNNMTSSHAVQLPADLSADTIYHYRVRTSDALGNLTVTADHTFKTLLDPTDRTAPTILGTSINAGTTAMTVTWNTDENASSYVAYSVDGITFLEQGSSDLTQVHSVELVGLAVGTLYKIKVISADAAGNVATDDNGGANYTQTTQSAPDGPVISGVQASVVDQTATITWTTDAAADSAVEYGIDTNYGKTVAVSEQINAHSIVLQDLLPSAVYHFRVHSKTQGESVSADYTFTTGLAPDKTAPNISTLNFAATTSTITATWNTNEESSSYVAYSVNGTTFFEQGSADLTQTHAVQLVGLVPNTNYKLKVISADAAGNVKVDDAAGVYYSQSTQANPSAPVISNISVSVSEQNSIISWNTDIEASSLVEYGADTNYGAVFGSQTLTKSHNVVLERLNSPATYHFRVRSFGNNQEAVSADQIFSTIVDVAVPSISSIVTNSLTSSSVTVTWTTSKDTDSVVFYGIDSFYSNIARDKNTLAAQTHSVTLDNLAPGINYHYQIVATDSAKNIVFSTDQSFTTLGSTEKPVLSQVATQATNQTSAVITWTTDKDASTKIFYSKDHSLDNSIDTGLVDTTHFITLLNLDKGATYYFKVVSIDLFGNETVSDEMSFNTEQDPSLDHEPLTKIENISNPPSVVTDKNALINFDTDQEAKCFIEFGTATGKYDEVPAMESDFNRNHAMRLTSLIFSTQYFYKITCQDNLSNVVSAEEGNFTTLPKQIDDPSGTENVEDETKTPPVISNVKVSKVSGEGATITWTTDKNASSFVFYGVSSVNENMAGNSQVDLSVDNYVTEHQVELKNLISSTQYVFKVVSGDVTGAAAQGSQQQFTTSSPTSLSSVKVTTQALGQALVSWKTSEATTSIVEYGISTAYGDKKDSSKYDTEHSVSISGLKAGTEYHFRVKGTDRSGTLYSSTDNTFESKSLPKISGISVGDVTEHGAIVRFQTDTPTDALVVYTNANKKEDTGFQGNPNILSNHEVTLKSLLSGATYDLKIKVRDEQGNETEQDVQSFTTNSDTTAPKIYQVKTDAALAQSNKVQTIISWLTDEPSTTTLEYKEGKNGEQKAVTMGGKQDTNHVLVTTNFKTGTAYFFHVISKDASGNESSSEEFALLTPKVKQNIIQIIINNFQQIFGWANFDSMAQ